MKWVNSISVFITVFITISQYLQIEPSEKGTSNNENMMLNIQGGRQKCPYFSLAITFTKIPQAYLPMGQTHFGSNQ